MTPEQSNEKHLRKILRTVPVMYLTVNTTSQRMMLISQGTIAKVYDVSTARAGVGNKEGSMRTPPGIHRIREKIGAGAPARRIFVSRKDTGRQWDERDSGENAILSRILRLEGMEEHVNKGPGVDSLERFIYIHGTNREDAVGREPVSHGCILMRNTDIIELFDKVKEGTVVYIQ